MDPVQTVSNPLSDVSGSIVFNSQIPALDINVSTGLTLNGNAVDLTVPGSTGIELVYDLFAVPPGNVDLTLTYNGLIPDRNNQVFYQSFGGVTFATQLIAAVNVDDVPLIVKNVDKVVAPSNQLNPVLNNFVPNVVLYNNTYWYAVGSGDSNFIMSPNGMNWSGSETACPYINTINDIAFDNYGMGMVVGDRQSEGSQIVALLSNKLFMPVDVATTTVDVLYTVVYATKWIAAGRDLSGNIIILESTNGFIWQEITTTVTMGTSLKIVYEPTTNIYLLYSGENLLVRSSSGSWETQLALTNQTYSSIAVNGATNIVVINDISNSQSIVRRTSPGGMSAGETTFPVEIISSQWDGTQWVLIDTNAQAYVSSNGSSWEPESTFSYSGVGVVSFTSAVGRVPTIGSNIRDAETFVPDASVVPEPAQSFETIPSTLQFVVSSEAPLPLVPAMPTIVSSTSTSVTLRYAYSQGIDTSYSVKYGVGTPSVSVPGTLSGGFVTVAITGLTQGTAYVFQSEVSNSGGAVVSSSLFFTTTILPATPPALTLVSATGTSIVVSYAYSASSGSSYGVRYGVTSPTTFVAGTLTGGLVTVTIPGLTPGTTYEILAAVSNSGGTVVSSSDSFTTLTLPVVPATLTLVSSTTTSLTVSYPYTEVADTTYGVDYGIGTPSTFVAGTLSSGVVTVTVPNLVANTVYSLRSSVSNLGGISSSSALPFRTNNPVPTVPPALTFVNSSSNSLTVTYSYTQVAGGSYGLKYGVGEPTTFVAGTLSAGLVTVTVTGLTSNTTYEVQAAVSNSGGVSVSSPVSFTTSSATSLTTNIVATFLIQGPVYNTPYSTALNYYVNCDAVGVGTGPQTFGSWYANTSGTMPAGYPASNLGGLVLADNNTADNSQRSYDYLAPLQAAGAKLIVSLGGYYADILGLFGPYQPPGYPGTNPSSYDVIQSFCATFYSESLASNPLGWSNAGWKGQRFDGLNLDFENVGYGGLPGVMNTYPVIPSIEPKFPQDNATVITNNSSGITYGAYIHALGIIPSAHHQFAPYKIINHAPLAASINAAVMSNQNGRNVAVTTALNTWFPFADFVAPTTANYNNTPSMALNHPDQMKYFDDVFVQMYNESPDNYLGGVNFPILLAQWGYVCLVAQSLGIKTPKVNIGLAKGPGSSARLSGEYYYPMYNTASPPNPNATLPVGNTYPNVGLNPVDSTNLKNAIAQATTMLQASGLPNAVTITPVRWCSGAGFWAGGAATIACKTIFNEVSNLPVEQTYTWSDAQYPAPDPLWGGNVPI
jgi:hypothetical protein